MTRPALIKKSDLMRAAEAAKQSGCRVEFRIGDTTIAIIPEDLSRRDDGIEYGRPIL
ncbi:hypothetical protein LJR030_000822 [Rhizobium sp. LjRoot30]|uniref:hypothetical protein n=1 Tax=Rhizobium sp. LjRoot30 TaxID=3342320 RepID=UPI000AA4FF0C